MTDKSQTVAYREKESMILDAAQKRFAHYGIHKVTMDEIAEDCGLGKASLYYYFPTKEDLFRGVIEREHREFLHRMEDVAGKPGLAAGKLRDFAIQRVALTRVYHNLTAFNHQAWMNARPLCIDLFDRFRQEEQQLIFAIIRGGKKSGEFELESSEKAAQVIAQALEGLRVRMLRRESPPDVQPSEYNGLQKEIVLLVELLLNGLNSRTGKTIDTKNHK